MKQFLFFLAFLGLSFTQISTEKKNIYTHSRLEEVLFSEIKIKDAFWTPKIEAVEAQTVPLMLDYCDQQGRINNFRIVAGLDSTHKYAIRNSPDAPVYKIIEAAAYALAQVPDAALQARVDSIISIVALAQAENGYIHTQFMLPENHPQAPDPKNKDVKTFGFGSKDQWKGSADQWSYAYSQLFTAGHLFEAAVAYYRATGKRNLLDIAVKLADHMVLVFADDAKLKGYGDHPQVEIGLMKLYEVVPRPEYLRLADRISRYVRFSRPVDLMKTLNSKPLHEQREVYGHCVRTAYVYSGATDVVRATGSKDLSEALYALWDNMVGRKMYIHGGTGNGAHAEQHGNDYELPIWPTYSECCANIATGQWGHAMHLLDGRAAYADVVEHETYNAALAGISLDGKKYFYSNKLNVALEGRKGKHGGVRETYLFCCPSKLPSFVGGISRWMYAKNEQGLFVNLYIGGEVHTTLQAQPVHFSMETKYPWYGQSTLTMHTAPSKPMAVSFRVPAWARSQVPFEKGLYYFKDKTQNKVVVRINGKAEKAILDDKGYLSVTRTWKAGDKVEIRFDMPIRRVYTRDEVVYNRGRVALMRGPILYTLEGIDNSFDVLKMVLPPTAKLTEEYRPDLLGGVVVLKGTGLIDGKPVAFTAVPYYAWENRGLSKAATLLIEEPGKIYPEKEDIQNNPNTNG